MGIFSAQMILDHIGTPYNASKGNEQINSVIGKNGT